MMYGWGFGWMGLVWLIALATIAWWIAADVRAHNQTGSPDARSILDERYARGDLTHSEYTAKRTTIEELAH